VQVCLLLEQSLPLPLDATNTSHDHNNLAAHLPLCKAKLLLQIYPLYVLAVVIATTLNKPRLRTPISEPPPSLRFDADRLDCLVLYKKHVTLKYEGGRHHHTRFLNKRITSYGIRVCSIGNVKAALFQLRILQINLRFKELYWIIILLLQLVKCIEFLHSVLSVCLCFF
jgi:hypothetical protein